MWIASYPKSGNTWVRFLVHHLAFGPVESSSQVNDRIPPIHASPAFESPPGRFVCAKTHLVFGDQHPRASETRSAIVIVRNPRDVAMSALNYRRLFAALPEGFTDAMYLRSFIEHRGDADFARRGFGTWAQNVASWTRKHAFPTLMVRYEDLKADATSQAGRIASFLGIDADGDALADASAASDLEELRALELAERTSSAAGTIFRGRDSGRYFMNTGGTGQRLDEIEPGLDRAFDGAFGEDASRFGYALR
ncbi:MAG: sulfotransferase domain-containing protein [Planctomycetota bacterium]